MTQENSSHTTKLSERHPEKQGLKQQNGVQDIVVPLKLSERHPEKQGLKLYWLPYHITPAMSSFRAPSRKTRIET